MRYAFRKISGTFTQSLELELNLLSCSVSTLREAWRTEGEPPARRPRPEARAFPRPEQAAHYLRYRVWEILEEGDWTFFSGDRSRLRSGEDFRPVVDRTRDHRPFRHRQSGDWADLDREGCRVDLWTGATGAPGRRERVFTDDEASAAALYRVHHELLRARGFVIDLPATHPAMLIERWQVELPDELYAFFAEGKAEAYTGRIFSGVPGEKVGARWRIDFDGAKVAAAAEGLSLGGDRLPVAILDGLPGVLVIELSTPGWPLRLVVAGQKGARLVEARWRAFLGRLRPAGPEPIAPVEPVPVEAPAPAGRRLPPIVIGD